MAYKIQQLTYEAAVEISRWSYPEPFSIYSNDGSQECIDELMDGSYYSVSDEVNNVIGYYCFGHSAQVPIGQKYGVYDDASYTDIGIGITPNLCGKGQGVAFFREGMEFAQKHLAADKFRLTVTAFNLRAITVYERLGFKSISSFKRATLEKEIEFLVMIG